MRMSFPVLIVSGFTSEVFLCSLFETRLSKNTGLGY